MVFHKEQLLILITDSIYQRDSTGMDLAHHGKNSPTESCSHLSVLGKISENCRSMLEMQIEFRLADSVLRGIQI